MTAPALVLATSGLAALTALVLSFVTDGRLARRLATASLWLALATVPCGIAWDVAFPPEPAPNTSVKATTLAIAIADVKNYGVAVMPGAGIAMIALRRAKAASSNARGARSRDS